MQTITAWCSNEFYERLVQHPLLKIHYTFILAAQVFEGHPVRVYATRKGSRKVFKVINIQTGEVKYLKREFKIPSNVECCQVFQQEVYIGEI